MEDLRLFASTIVNLMQKLEDRLEYEYLRRPTRYAIMHLTEVKALLDKESSDGTKKDQNELGKAPYE